MTEHYITKFYEFLEDEVTLTDIENFVYNTQELESEIGRDVYLDLITLNYKDKDAEAILKDIVINKLTHKEQFETWRLKKTLQNFINDPTKTHIYLDQIYHLYYGTLQENGQRHYEYKFLQNLGLNCLYWIEEGYMRAIHGDNWEKELKSSLKDLDFYHHQLQPFATIILKAIEDREIEILDNGTYRITHALKEKLESDSIYNLKHPGHIQEH
jgi:hypothetical protein